MSGKKFKIDEFAKRLQALLDDEALEEASAFCGEAVAAHPGNAELWRLSGIVALRRGDCDGALRSFQASVKLAPASAPAHSALASALLKKGERTLGRAALENALSFDPRRAHDVESLATIMLKSGETAPARELLRKSFALGLRCPSACALMASAELDAGNLEASSSLFVLAARWSERAFVAIESSAVALMGKGSFETARLVFEPVAKAFPDKPELLINLAICQMQTGRFDVAFETFEAVAKLAPEEPAYLINYGTALYKTGRFEEAVSSFKKTLSIDPSNYHAGLALSLALLKSGRLKEGWPYWEFRLKQPDLAKLARNKLPLWSLGAPASARVLVRCEQGFGDSVFFARFMPSLRSRCSHLSFICRKELLALFEEFPGIDELIPLDGDEESSRGCDFRLPLASLPQHFIESTESIPKLELPYLKAPAGRLAKWRDFVAANAGSGKRIKAGICWSGSQSNIIGRMRSIPAAELLPLLKLPGFAWFSLQADAMEREMDSLDAGIVRTSSLIEDFADTAALIENLDVIVSIDTAVAHLAGAMLKPVKVALCYEADWRWFTGRSDSPWYPSMTLFRQENWGDWGDVVESIGRSLPKS